jgi:hypothetical protein
MDDTEIYLLSCFSKYREYANHEYLIIPEDKDIKYFINKIKNVINTVNDTNDIGTYCDLLL